MPEIQNVKVFYAARDDSKNTLEKLQKESSEYIEKLKKQGFEYEATVHTSAAQYAWYYTLTIIIQ